MFPSLPVSASDTPDDISSIIVSMESNAEDIVDAALTKNASTTQTLYQKIQHELMQLQKHINQQAFNERRSRELLMAYSWMRVLAIDLKQRAWIGTAIAANQLSASMIRFTNYPTLRQRDIAWMGYLGRELLLLNMEDANANAQLLNARRANLLETWSRIRKSLIMKDFRNKPLVLRGDNLIHLLRDNHEPEATMATAKKLLDFVDEIKQVK
jgi:hypothetical protein